MKIQKEFIIECHEMSCLEQSVLMIVFSEHFHVTDTISTNFGSEI